jgi:hypothetical protein
MPRGGGVAVRRTLGEPSLPSACGSLDFDCWIQPGAVPNTYRGSILSHFKWENSGLRRGHALETLLCPHPALLNASGLSPQTLLVSTRLGGGAATQGLVTHHQGGERERGSNQTVRLRGVRPDLPTQSMLYIRKEHRAGSPLCGPVRRRAPSFPSVVTRSQSV